MCIYSRLNPKLLVQVEDLVCTQSNNIDFQLDQWLPKSRALITRFKQIKLRLETSYTNLCILEFRLIFENYSTWSNWFEN